MSVFQDVVTVAKPYMGPASEQFIAKQCRLFLKIEPEVLTQKHVKELASWVETGATRFLDGVQSKELATKIARMG